jgi:hypothetical protein
MTTLIAFNMGDITYNDILMADFTYKWLYI